MQGEPPSHPELLDWLAVELQANGWDLKRLHRLIVMSATYRQASRVTSLLRERDPENRLLARGPRFRLPSLLLRDVALAASGLLDDRIGGTPVYPYQPPSIWESLAITMRSLFSARRSTIQVRSAVRHGTHIVCSITPGGITHARHTSSAPARRRPACADHRAPAGRERLARRVLCLRLNRHHRRTCRCAPCAWPQADQAGGRRSLALHLRRRTDRGPTGQPEGTAAQLGCHLRHGQGLQVRRRRHGASGRANRP